MDTVKRDKIFKEYNDVDLSLKDKYNTYDRIRCRLEQKQADDVCPEYAKQLQQLNALEESIRMLGDRYQELRHIILQWSSDNDLPICADA